MGKNFSAVNMGSLFTTTEGETFKKTSELTYDDMAGIERYIDPFFDAKIGPDSGVTTPGVDTSAKIVKGDKEEAPVKKAKKSKKK